MNEGAEIVDLALRANPELIVHGGNLPATAEALRDLLADSGKFFDRGIPVRIVRPADGGLPSAVPLTKHNVVIEAHRLCQPVKLGKDGDVTFVTLPDRVAQMYLDMMGEWNLPPLTGVTTAPLLSEDGNIRGAEGYDLKTGLWCCGFRNFAYQNGQHAPMPRGHCGFSDRLFVRFRLLMRPGGGMHPCKSKSSISPPRRDGTRAAS
jgi:hypothetical protein